MAAGKGKIVEARVVAFAEQLGRLIGSVETKSERLVDKKALNAQLTQLRDGAVELLSHLGSAVASGRAASKPATRPAKPATPAGRSGGAVDAPGKTHRKQAKSTRGTKHSDETISKVVAAKTMRRPQRRGRG